MLKCLCEGRCDVLSLDSFIGAIISADTKTQITSGMTPLGECIAAEAGRTCALVVSWHSGIGGWII